MSTRRIRVGVESGSGSKPNKHGNFVAFKNASRVFRNGLFWFIGCLRNVFKSSFCSMWWWGWEPETGMEDLSTKRGLQFSTVKGLNKEKRDPTMALLAHPLLVRPADYLYVFLKERIGWIMATAIHFLFFPFLFLI